MGVLLQQPFKIYRILLLFYQSVPQRPGPRCSRRSVTLSSRRTAAPTCQYDLEAMNTSMKKKRLTPSSFGTLLNLRTSTNLFHLLRLLWNRRGGLDMAGVPCKPVVAKHSRPRRFDQRLQFASYFLRSLKRRLRRFLLLVHAAAGSNRDTPQSLLLKIPRQLRTQR